MTLDVFLFLNDDLSKVRTRFLPNKVWDRLWYRSKYRKSIGCVPTPVCRKIINMKQRFLKCNNLQRILSPATVGHFQWSVNWPCDPRRHVCWCMNAGNKKCLLDRLPRHFCTYPVSMSSFLLDFVGLANILGGLGNATCDRQWLEGCPTTANKNRVLVNMEPCIQ